MWSYAIHSKVSKRIHDERQAMNRQMFDVYLCPPFLPLRRTWSVRCLQGSKFKVKLIFYGISQSSIDNLKI